LIYAITKQFAGKFVSEDILTQIKRFAVQIDAQDEEGERIREFNRVTREDRRQRKY
jgi:hypothetical protein